MLYTSQDGIVQDDYVEVLHDKESTQEAIVTLLVPSERLNSFKRKIDRVKRLADFEKEKKDRFELLTKREIEIVSLLASGFDNPLIAESLFISRNTVEQHRKNIRRKLEVHSLVHLVEYAMAFDLV